MVWKMFSPYRTGDEITSLRSDHGQYHQLPKRKLREETRKPKPHQPGNLIALVGIPIQGKPSSKRDEENLECICNIDNELLGYNAGANMVMLRMPQNERDFDIYASFPFMKGVTERDTGRTLVILGSNAHHGDAMQNQFSNMLWTPQMAEEVKKYGNTIRWINVGGVKNGFIGLDYNPRARQDEGVANSLRDIKFLAEKLMEFGYDPGKKLFLLKPPYIVESEEGRKLRDASKETLEEYAKISVKNKR